MDSTETKPGSEPTADPRGGRRNHWLMIACILIAAIVVFLAFGAPLATAAFFMACAAVMGFMVLLMMRG